MQVGYLAFGFVWGIFRLLAVLQIPTAVYKFQEWEHPHPVILSYEDEHDGWGFGQVVSILLLMAPLTTIIDQFEHGMLLRFPWCSAAGARY